MSAAQDKSIHLLGAAVSSRGADSDWAPAGVLLPGQEAFLFTRQLVTTFVIFAAFYSHSRLFKLGLSDWGVQLQPFADKGFPDL